MADTAEGYGLRSLTVANGAGFWGDNLDAPYLLARDAPIDVLTLEYLAELTMAILAHVRSRDPEAGYIGDFPPLLSRLVPILSAREGLRIVTNAGGLNPLAAARRCGAILEGAGLGGLPIGVVTGDDVLDRIREWVGQETALDHLESGQPIDTIVDRLVAANAYLGARPIADAIRAGARVTLTGRVADASLTLGPAVAEFGWDWDDWPRLAGATTAGHVIECGAQATGGLWFDWERLPDPAGIGYPIAEIHRDGSCTITKPNDTGGVVNVGTVSEQLVYEIDDPRRYRTPDVDVDLTTLSLTQEGPDRVRIAGASGRPAGSHWKLSAIYRDGWTASGMLAVVGRNAAAKARAAGRVVLERVRRAGFELAQSNVECLGAGDVVPGAFRPDSEPLEVVLRIAVRDPRREAVERFCRELAPLVTSGPPGIAGYATGRPEARPAFGYWPALVPRSLLDVRVETRPAREWARYGGEAKP